MVASYCRCQLVSKIQTLVGHRTVTESAISTFGWLTGDYSRIHFDHHFGGETGTGTFAHGLLGASWAVGMMAFSAPQLKHLQDKPYFLSGFEINYSAVIQLGDTLAVSIEDAGSPDKATASTAVSLKFCLLNQHQQVAASGLAHIENTEQLDSAPPPLWRADHLQARSVDDARTYFANDMPEQGPQGELAVRTLTETDIVNFASFTSDLNPAYLNTEIAADSRFGQRIVPPMLIFCLSFASWLRCLLEYKFPDNGSAGHLRDKWVFYKPVFIGDTISVKHRPISYRESNRRPGHALVGFGLQILNQRGELVQTGEMLFLMPRHPSAV